MTIRVSGTTSHILASKYKINRAKQVKYCIIEDKRETNMDFLQERSFAKKP